jgi:hypothetical protein
MPLITSLVITDWVILLWDTQLFMQVTKYRQTNWTNFQLNEIS